MISWDSRYGPGPTLNDREMLRMPTVLKHAMRSLLLVGLAPALAAAPGLEYVKSHYTKHEYRIPMRDGKRLFTAVYVPKDTAQTYPIMLTRTPYSVEPYGVDRSKGDLGPSALFGKAGYIFVYQDVRGRWMSEGDFVNMRPILDVKPDAQAIDESTDTFDTIAWLIGHVPNHNGKVGQWGISYPGFYTDCGIIGAHPALKAASPQAPVTDWFIGDDWHHNGAFLVTHAFNFLASFGHPRPEPTKKFRHDFDHETPDGYDFFLRLGPLANADARHFKNDVAFWDEVMKHGTYDDFWKARNLRQHIKNVRPEVLTVGGWFDAENLFGALETYRRIEATSPNCRNTLVMGPWLHGGWARGGGDKLGDARFDSKTAEFFRENIEFPFFEFHLKGKGAGDFPEAWVFETGTNQWRKYDTWPPKKAQPKVLYLHADSKLSFDPPTEADASAFNEYVSDPAKPVPYIDKTSIKMEPEYMVADQRAAGRRTDVLVYETEPLANDLTLAGPIQADLHVSTSGTDSDWVVKLIDVYPDDFPDPDPNPTGLRMGGYQQLVRGDVMRGKFRDSYETPAPFTPGEPTPVAFAGCRISTTRSGPATRSWSRSRAVGSPWSTATRRRSSISTRPRNPISRRPPSACIAHGRCRRT